MNSRKTAFERIKKILTSETVLAFYKLNSETVVTADASSFGIGAELKQKQEDGRYKTVASASRSLTSVEPR